MPELEAMCQMTKDKEQLGNMGETWYGFDSLKSMNPLSASGLLQAITTILN